MHWLQMNWFTVLAVAYALASEVMPLLPNKAQSVIGAALELAKLVASRFGKKLPALRAVGEEEPK
jgi:hypothetical protein